MVKHSVNHHILIPIHIIHGYEFNDNRSKNPKVYGRNSFHIKATEIYTKRKTQSNKFSIDYYLEKLWWREFIVLKWIVYIRYIGIVRSRDYKMKKKKIPIIYFIDKGVVSGWIPFMMNTIISLNLFWIFFTSCCIVEYIVD